jgi:hypothetical protein
MAIVGRSNFLFYVQASASLRVDRANCEDCTWDRGFEFQPQYSVVDQTTPLFIALPDLELPNPVICNSHALDNFNCEIPYFPRQDEERNFGFILACQV